jgi:hypothetical protein
MAIKDAKQYYYTMLNQYLEMKADLADFERALADGHITEDQLEAVREEVFVLENNFDRISYIMYLLEMPNRSHKKDGYRKSNKALEQYFTDTRATMSAVREENKSALDQLREELKKLKDAGN